MGVQSTLIDETGHTYGYLTVLERGPNSSDNRVQWWCQCQCGNKVLVRAKALRNGNTKSCGCYQRQRAAESNMNRAENLIGKRFGKLVVLSEAGFVKKNSGKNARIYNCQCDCGNICQVQHQYLAYGDTTSCGCVRSRGELTIKNILKEKGYKFQQEYIFEDLKDICPLRFDFAVFNDDNSLKCLIECQGEQHYDMANGYYNSDVVKHDEMKRKYCLEHNIQLIEIPYKTRQNLTWDDLIQGGFNGV